MLTELNAVLDKIERDHTHRLVIRSAKRSGFIHPAPDSTQFRGMNNPAPIEATLTRGHAIWMHMNQAAAANDRRDPRLLHPAAAWKWHSLQFSH